MTTAEPDTFSDDGGTSNLFELAYQALHELAAGYLRRERADHTLQPTALVHEAYLKLQKYGNSSDWQGLHHFQAVAASAMRQILVDHARQRATKKRGGDWQRVTLSSDVLGQQQPLELLALDEALRKLHQLDPRKCSVVELRFFGGLTCQQAAEHLHISHKTAEADWYFARAWLREKLSDTSA